MGAVDHENCRCNVGHTKESNAEAIRILKSESSITIHSPKSSFGSRHDRIFPEYIIRNICVIRIIYSEVHQKLLVGSLHYKENVFQTFWAVVKLKNVFLHVF
jgi:hypothetical protein